MPIITTAGKRRGKVVWWDTGEGMRTGRWCYAPFLPDRCHNCFGPDMSNYPAEGYIATRQRPFPAEILNQIKDERRQGICHRCHPELADPDYVGGGVETRFYFSGVAGSEERAMLQAAQVGHIMVDIFDYPLVSEWTTVRKALDCGAYRIWKSQGRLTLDLDEYMETAEAEQENLEFVVAGEVIGDAEATRTLWLQTIEWLTQNMGDIPSRYWPRIVPVWHWGSSIGLLEQYLEESFLVAIGGLVPWLRAKNRAVLSDVVALANQHPGRFHIPGVNWGAAIEQLFGLVYSMDTSKWLDGARYGSCITQDPSDKHLQAIPKAIARPGGLSRYDLCVHNAKVLQAFADNPKNLAVSLAKCATCGRTFNTKGLSRKYCTTACDRTQGSAGKTEKNVAGRKRATHIAMNLQDVPYPGKEGRSDV